MIVKWLCFLSNKDKFIDERSLMGHKNFAMRIWCDLGVF